MANKTLDIILGYTDKLTGGLKKTLTSIGTFGKKAKAVFHSLGEKFKSALLSPQTLISAGFVGLGAAITKMALKASGDFEALQTQLEAVLPTAEAAKDAFDESMTFSARTPFSADEVVQTRIALEGVGISGPKAVEAVAEASAALNRNMLDVAAAVRSLETEPLRNLGIMLKRNGDEFIFEYKDKMGQAQKVVANSFAEAQQAALDIFQTKFSGGVEKLANTWGGKISTLKDAWKQFLDALGDGFMPQAKQIVEDITNLLNKGIDSGKINEIGTKIGEWVQDVRNGVAGVLAQVKSIDDVKAVFIGIGQWIKDQLIEGGKKLAAFLAEKAPIIGDAIGTAIRESATGLFQGGQDRRVAKQQLKQRGIEATDENVAQYVAEMQAESQSARGQELAEKVTGGSSENVGKTVWDYINESLAKSQEAAKSDRDKLYEALESGLTGDALDKAIEDLELSNDDIQLLAEYTEAFNDSTSETTESAKTAAEAAKKTAEEATKASTANVDAHVKVQDSMRLSSEAALKTAQVADTTQQQVGQAILLMQQLAAQQDQMRADLGMVASQVESMRT